MHQLPSRSDNSELPKIAKVKVLQYQGVIIVTGELLHEVAFPFLPSLGVRG